MTGVGGPIPEEHKTVQARISEYAEALGFGQDAFMTFAWKLVQFSHSDLPIIASFAKYQLDCRQLRQSDRTACSQAGDAQFGIETIHEP